MASEQSPAEKIAQNTLDSIVTFNRDMRTLALNAYQLEDLMNFSLEENDLLIRWMKNLDAQA